MIISGSVWSFRRWLDERNLSSNHRTTLSFFIDTVERNIMATDNQYSRSILACDPRIRGTAICHIEGKCSGCIFAHRYEHPDEQIIYFEKVV